MLFFKNKKVIKIIINARITGILFVDFDLNVFTNDKNNDFQKINFGKENSKKQYDGNFIFTIDTSKIECYNLVEVSVSRGWQYITLNNFTLEYEENFLSIDYKSFKKPIIFTESKKRKNLLSFGQTIKFLYFMFILLILDKK